MLVDKYTSRNTSRSELGGGGGGGGRWDLGIFHGIGDPILQLGGGWDCFFLFLLLGRESYDFFCLLDWANFSADSSPIAVALLRLMSCHV